MLVSTQFLALLLLSPSRQPSFSASSVLERRGSHADVELSLSLSPGVAGKAVSSGKGEELA